MVQASVYKCLKATGGSRFDLVQKAARRAHDLATGAMTHLSSEHRNHKATTLALLEIASENSVRPSCEAQPANDLD